MPNNIATVQHIARSALPHLIENLVFPNLIHKDFSSEFAPGKGQIVRVRKPVIYEAHDFKDADGIQMQDIQEETVDVTLDKIASVDINVTALEAATSFDDIDRLFIRPAAIALAQKINADGLGLYADVASVVGDPNVTPASLDALAAIKGALNDAKVPLTDRYAVLDTAADTSLSMLPELVNADKSGSTEALREGSIGRVFGVNYYMSQAVKHHVSGLTAAKSVTIAGGAAKGATMINIAGTTLTGHMTKGDLLSIAERTYTVAEDSVAASSNAINGVKIFPALAENAEAGTGVMPLGKHTANLAFNKNAFAFVTRPLASPAGVESYTTSYNGISLRVTRGYDMKYKREIMSMDVLYGYKTVYPELAVRVLG